MVESKDKALFHLALGNSRYALELATTNVVRAQILLTLGRFQEAIDAAESEQDLYGRLVLAKALFANGEFERAIIEVQKLKERQHNIENPTEAQDVKRQVEVLARKIEIEMTNSNRIGNINDAAYLTSSKPVKSAGVAVEEKKQAPIAQPGPAIDKKFDWYQNPTYVFISYKVASPQVS
jgi:tetratricopeptide (TPR) repeat protein